MPSSYPILQTTNIVALIYKKVNAVALGGDVLLLTFNMTLVNYLKMRLENVRADFLRNKIHVDHYHRFFRQWAQRNRLQIKQESYDDLKFFAKASRLPKFAGIFVDEVQDYQTEWLKILQQYFLAENGEFVVFGDPKQNVYKRALDKDGNVLLGVIPGLWNKSLTKGYRFANPAFSQLAMAFQSQFLPHDADKIEKNSQETQGTLSELYRYEFMGSDSSSNEVYRVCKDFIESNGIDYKDVVILASKRNILQEIDFAYRQDLAQETMTAFVSKENDEELQRKNPSESWKYKCEYERLDKVGKYRFTMNAPKLKLSTMHSFKGWEAPTVICILLPSDSDQEELVYTGLTRAQHNMLVINLGNITYHKFFDNMNRGIVPQTEDEPKSSKEGPLQSQGASKPVKEGESSLGSGFKQAQGGKLGSTSTQEGGLSKKEEEASNSGFSPMYDRFFAPKVEADPDKLWEELSGVIGLSSNSTIVDSALPKESALAEESTQEGMG